MLVFVFGSRTCLFLIKTFITTTAFYGSTVKRIRKSDYLGIGAPISSRLRSEGKSIVSLHSYIYPNCFTNRTRVRRHTGMRFQISKSQPNPTLFHPINTNLPRYKAQNCIHIPSFYSHKTWVQLQSKPPQIPLLSTRSLYLYQSSVFSSKQKSTRRVNSPQQQSQP